MPMSGNEMIEAAKRKVEAIPVSEVNAKLQAGEELVILDVREPDEWEAGHIEQATFLPRGRIEGSIEKMVPDKNTPIVCH